MNNILTGLDNLEGHQLPPKRHERQHDRMTLGRDPTTNDSQHLLARYLSPAIVVFFWIAQFASNTLYSLLNWTDAFSAQLLPRAIICFAGAILSFGFIVAQSRMRPLTLKARAWWSVVLAIAGSAVHGAINHVVFGYFIPDYNGHSPLWQVYSLEILNRLWVFACLSAITLAIAYSSDIEDKERRIRALQSLAQDVQLRALRSQLNPHFLFNALNSVTALIASNRKEAAEAITENLADFLRITLALDPHRLIPLREEIRLQQLYLDIQEFRFPTRLKVGFEIPDELADALLPNLITQPLIENTIKYAVARSTEPVNLTVSARRSGSSLLLAVEDDGGNAEGEITAGCGLGISNVHDRLLAHYGERATLRTERRAEGGFRNLLSIPLSDKL